MHTAFLLFSKKKKHFFKTCLSRLSNYSPIKYHYKKKNSEKQNVESVTFLGNLWKAVRTKHLYLIYSYT